MKTILTFFALMMAGVILPAQILQVPGDFPTIQQAIAAANPGDTVLVADGIYYEQLNFLGKKPLLVASYYLLEGSSSHIQNTIIDGSQLTNPDSASVVYFMSDEDTTSILCGFTIRNGKGTHSGSQNTLEGGGIWISGAGAKIVNNRISRNTCEVYATADVTGCQGGGIRVHSMQNQHWVVIRENCIDSNIIVNEKQNGYCNGAGISASGNILISNNTIRQNAAKRKATSTVFYSNGAGIAVINDPAIAAQAIICGNIVLNNTLLANLAMGAGVYISDIDLNFSGNTVTENYIGSLGPVSDLGGAGMVAQRCTGDALIRNNSFSFNRSDSWAGGLAILSTLDEAGWFKLENNLFRNNFAAGWGGAFGVLNCPVLIQNNIFTHNHATYGGVGFIDRDAAYSPNHSALLINNSFAYNSATYYSGGLDFSRTNPLLLNCLFWNNTAPYCNEIMVNSGYVEVAYSNLDTNEVVGSQYYGPGIMMANPLFADTVHLIPQTFSPGVDAGIASYVCMHSMEITAPMFDILGNPRPNGAGVDLGAYDQVFFVGMNPSFLSEEDVRIFPNPAVDEVNLLITPEHAASLKIGIYSALGECVLSLNEAIQAGVRNRLVIPAEGLSPGMYFYTFELEGRRYTGKFMLLTGMPHRN